VINQTEGKGHVQIKACKQRELFDPWHVILKSR